MTRSLMSLLAAAALAATVPALAQQTTPQPKPPEQKPAEQKPPEQKPADQKPAETKAPAPAAAIPKGVFYKGQGPTQYLARDRLIGVQVVNPKGEILGDIEDLIMGATSNDVQGVVVGVGGFLGVGEKKVGVRYSALKVDQKDGKKVVILDTTKEVLKALEPYGRTEPRRTLLEKASQAARRAAEQAKDAAKKASAATKGAVEKASDATKGAVDKAKDAAKPKTN